MVDDKFEQVYRGWHTYCSYIKSALRIVGCLTVLFSFPHSLMFLAVFFLIAEIVGIVEEWA